VTTWTCPKCKRQFGKKKQWHSCLSYSVEDHFKDKSPELKKTFDSLEQRARRFGPVRTDAVKSLITLSGQSHFAAVYVRKNSLSVEFALERKLSDERIEKSTKLLNRYCHFVNLTKPQDVDKQLMAWLEEAYFLTSPAEDNEKPTLFKRKR